MFEHDAAPPNGTLVEVTPVGERIVAGGRPGLLIRFSEQRRALLAVIGMWKMDDRRATRKWSRMIDERRMKKYG